MWRSRRTDPRRRSGAQLLALAAVFVLALVAVSSRLMIGAPGERQASVVVGPSSGEPGDQELVGGSCAAPIAATLRDIVKGDDDWEGRWPHTPGQEITVYFAYGTLPARYAEFVKTGAQLWSRSPCVAAVAVPACPAGANCSTVTVEAKADDGSDGNSDSVDVDGVRKSNKLTLYTDYLDKAKESGALATAVHEMGHALGLMHRADRRSVMYEDTIDMDHAVPDAIDYQNLVALYGGGRPPGVADNG